MKVRVEELSAIERKLSIEVEPAIIADELSRAYVALGRQVKVPGFRPGKIPRRILEQRFKEKVEDDVVQKVVERAYMEAIREHQVDAVASPEVTNSQRLQPNEPFAFEAKVQVKPKLDPKDYTGLSLKKLEVKVDEEKVTEQLERLRQANSRLEPVTDRDVAQAADFAVIDYQGMVDGQPFPGGKAQDVTVEVAPGELIRGNAEALAGLKIGDSREVPYTFPADYGVDGVKGKTAAFHMTLKGLKHKVAPELDDAFAQAVQGGQTLEELKGKIRADLERSIKAKNEAEEREAVIKALAEKNPFEIPSAMVDRAIDAMLRGALRGMAERGMDPRSLNLDFARLREEMRERADTEVRGSLLFEAIADKENIQVADEDMEKRLAHLSESDPATLAQLKKRMKDSGDRQAFSLRVREEKTIEFLKARASYP